MIFDSLNGPSMRLACARYAHDVNDQLSPVEDLNSVQIIPFTIGDLPYPSVANPFPSTFPLTPSYTPLILQEEMQTPQPHEMPLVYMIRGIGEIDRLKDKKEVVGW